LIHHLPASKLPKGVSEIANKWRTTSSITATWRRRNAGKIKGNSEADVLKMFFGNKIEKVAKVAVHQVKMFYNKMYRTKEELPSGTNNMSHLYYAIKNNLFVREKKAAYFQRRTRQFNRERPDKCSKITKDYLVDGFDDFVEEAKLQLVIADFFPTHWLVANFPHVLFSH
jgi:hypothetical protein